MFNHDYFDNTVYFEINKDLRETDKNQMILYFQSKNNSGGGEILQYTFDETINSLEIIFRDGASKAEILKRKFFKFKSFDIKACEPPAVQNQNSTFHKFENVLLVSNINRVEDENNVDEYLKYLVQNRNVIKKVKSIVHENLTFFQFNYEFNFEEVKKRFNLNQNKGKNEISIYEAYETQSVLVKINSKNFNENYFNSKFKFKNFMYWQLPFGMDDSPFVILKFLDIDFKFDFLLKYSKIDKKEYFIENCFNYNLLNDFLNNHFGKKVENILSVPVYKHVNDVKKIKIKKKKTILNCSQCPFIGSSKLVLAKHKKSHIFSTSNIVKCKYCDFFAKSVCNILSHEKLHKKSTRNKENIF